MNKGQKILQKIQRVLNTQKEALNSMLSLQIEMEILLQEIKRMEELSVLDQFLVINNNKLRELTRIVVRITL